MYGHYEQKRRNCCGRTQEKQVGRGVPRSREARGRPQGETQLPPVPRRKEPVQKPRTEPKPHCSPPPPKPPPLPWEPPKASPPPAWGRGKEPVGMVPTFLRRLLPNSSPGDLLALLILLLLLAEGGEDAQNTILTLLIFLFL